jgi:hypothetical protein
MDGHEAKGKPAAIANHAIAVCLCTNPDGTPNAVDAVLPTVKWWGVHRHVPLSDWYTQEMHAAGWALLIIPSMSGFVWPELQDTEGHTVASLQRALEDSVKNMFFRRRSHFNTSRMVHHNRTSRLHWEIREPGGDINQVIADTVMSITAARVEAITAAAEVGG